MALKDAGVVRARFGDVELVFAPEVQPEAEPFRVVELPSAPQTQNTPPVPGRPGYSALFGVSPPKFTPDSE